MNERKCYYCHTEMPKGTEHIIYDGKLTCMNCTVENEVTHYFVGGEYIGTCESDDIEKVYAWEDYDNLEKLEDEPHESS